MKNLLDIGGVIVDAVISIIIAIIVFNILGALFVSNAFGAEQPLTKDEQTVAITLMGEARGEKNAGMYAVACVIQKRADERKLTPAQVCKQPWQFSCWNKGQENYIDLMKRLLKSNTTQAQYAKKLARAICAGGRLVQSFTGEANHYYSMKVMKKAPYWAFKKVKVRGAIVKVAIKPSKIIGNHVFYKGL